MEGEEDRDEQRCCRGRRQALGSWRYWMRPAGAVGGPRSCHWIVSVVLELNDRSVGALKWPTGQAAGVHRPAGRARRIRAKPVTDQLP